MTADRSVENVVRFKYLGTILTNKKLIGEEIEGRIYFGNACYHSTHFKLNGETLKQYILGLLFNEHLWHVLANL
jgi:hypothetical protein